MRFDVLGPLRVRDGAGAPVAVPEAKVRALLAALLAHDGGPVSADRLIDDLWGARPPGKPANALQTKVSQLRRALGGADRVVLGPAGYRLEMTDADVDADRFRALLVRAGAAEVPAARAELLAEALGLWRGPAYADFADEDFVRPAVQRLTEQRLTAIEEQSLDRLELGEDARLADELTALVVRHPLREGLRAVQLRALYRAGRQSEALASYAELRVRLADELGVDPGPALVALYEAILRQDPALAPAAPAARAARTPAPGTAGLPIPLTPLVGRADAVREVGQLLRTERLVTLTGPGGVGKTRLALAAAAREDGTPGAPDVRLVELAGRHTDPTEALAAALGLRDDTTAGAHDTTAERIASALRDRRTLLILDNCEHLVEPVAHLAARLLRSAAGLRVLATSQEPLGLAGELLYPVEPLQPTDAVRLFTERAAATAPGFVLDPTTEDAVRTICRRLDGIPLALELAATRVRGLGVHQLAERLDQRLGDRFRVLAAEQRGAPDRQRTLRAVIDWSWELLTPPERTVLARLSAHSDGWTPEAAEAVCADVDAGTVLDANTAAEAGTGVPVGSVPDLLARLVDRSLVQTVAGPPGAEIRYRLLESVAAYAAERLAERADHACVRHRHLLHHVELAERTEPYLRGPEQRRLLPRLDAEAGNLRAALDTALRHGYGGEALRLVTALSWYWLLSGRPREARRSLAAALGAAPPSARLRATRAEACALHTAFALLTGEPAGAGAAMDTDRDVITDAISSPARRARARWLLAYGLFNAGDLAAAERLTAEALAAFRAVDDRWGVAAALARRAQHALIRGDLVALRHDGERSAALFRELGDRWGQSQSVGPLASLAEIRGDYAEAARIHEEGLRIAEELGLGAEIASRLSGLGRLALLTGDHDRARELHKRARRTAAEQGYRFGEIHAELGLALGARRAGDLDTAEAYLLRIRDWYAEVSTEAGNSLVLAELGFVAELRGDAPAARALHLDGLAVARAMGDPRAVALASEGLAGAESLA
ncbi:hypothetical protein QR77_20415, partial [Streptomyces sp. 150FB]|uniref:BTAD domain-containing putative transcriptional regulator n=1 Tax=Streptomyces sp. 150FB TaxID=1576605 RepID=UPI000588FEFE